MSTLDDLTQLNITQISAGFIWRSAVPGIAVCMDDCGYDRFASYEQAENAAIDPNPLRGIQHGVRAQFVEMDDVQAWLLRQGLSTEQYLASYGRYAD